MQANKLRILLVLFAMLALSVGTSVAHSGARQAPTKSYWTPLACKQKLQNYRVIHPPDDVAPGAMITTTDGHNFHVAQAVCIGRGGQQTCEWGSGAGNRSRIYSAFAVYSRSNSGLVRSFTLDTRRGHGVPVAGETSRTPPLFYVSNIKLIASKASPARFGSIVGPIAARVAQQQDAKGCARASG